MSPHRKTYYNGDPIGLEYTGCDGCSPNVINGKLAHERGCSFAWKDYSVTCKLCGGQFNRTHQLQQICEDCEKDW
jgi:hypothetical protein